jgi:hypothetical protein
MFLAIATRTRQFRSERQGAGDPGSKANSTAAAGWVEACDQVVERPAPSPLTCKAMIETMLRIGEGIETGRRRQISGFEEETP